MAINLTGMFQNLGGATDALSKSIMGSPVPTDPMQRNAMQRMGVTNPLLQQFGQGLGLALGRNMGSPMDLVKQTMASIDPNDPQAVLKIASAIKDVDPVKAAQLIGEYKVAQTKASAGDMTFAGDTKFKGKDGNVYWATQQRTPRGVKTIIMDMQGNVVPPNEIPNLELKMLDGNMTVDEKVETARQEALAKIETGRYEQTMASIDGVRADDATLTQIQDVLTDPNFDFSLFDQFAPSVLQTPQMKVFNQLRNQRGLDVVANGKFGALSESELAVANENAFPRFTDKESALDWIDKRLQYNSIIKDQLNTVASMLLNGQSSVEVQKYLKEQEGVGFKRRMAEREQKARKEGRLEVVTPSEWKKTKEDLKLTNMSDADALEYIYRTYGGSVIKISE